MLLAVIKVVVTVVVAVVWDELIVELFKTIDPCVVVEFVVVGVADVTLALVVFDVIVVDANVVVVDVNVVAVVVVANSVSVDSLNVPSNTDLIVFIKGYFPWLQNFPSKSSVSKAFFLLTGYENFYS